MAFVPGAQAPRSPSAESHWFALAPRGLLLRQDETGLRLPARRDLERLGLDPERGAYFGQLDGVDCFALDASSPAGSPAAGSPAAGSPAAGSPAAGLPAAGSPEAGSPAAGLPADRFDPFEQLGLRSLFGHFGDEWLGVAGRATQLATFAATHRRCGRCGDETQRTPAEHSVRCAVCDLTFYPRISPAIIVLIRRGERALLGRAPRFPEGLYSALAGFVEPGESLEETLVREVREEVGIEVRGVRYVGSQSWPFPHSLMVAFVAEHAAGEIAIDREEIVDARWFSASELPKLPPRLSIARRLIDDWIADVTD